MAIEQKLTIEQIEQRLIDGNERFINDHLKNEGLTTKRREETTSGQAPYAIILSCADSRIIPEATFDAGIGELFVVRVAGNVADTTSLASIEYAIAHLGSKVVVVLGHQSCGAVTAATLGGDNGYNLNILLAQITPAIAVSDNLFDINSVVKKNAELQAVELINRSQIVRKAVEDGQVRIKPAFYNLDTGKVEYL
ncbi:MAG: carbonic anhydrase [Cyclobacteriaceae bacterium]